MNKELSMNIIPDQLNIKIRTSIPGYQMLKYNPSMTIKNIDEKSVRFNPLIKLNTSVINKIPEKYKIIQFFNSGLFQSLLTYTGGSPAKNLTQATYNRYIDNNIKITLDTIFPTNSVIYIGKEPYVIGDVQWTTGDWKLEVKQKKKEIDIDKITNPILYNKLVKEEIQKGEKQLAELPKELLSGNNYNGPPVLANYTEEKIVKLEPPVKHIKPESKELVPFKPESKELVPFKPESKELVPFKPESKELVPFKPESKELVPFKPESKELVPSKTESKELVPSKTESKELVPSNIESKELIPTIQKQIEPLKDEKKEFQIKNEPETKQIEEITIEERTLYDDYDPKFNYDTRNIIDFKDFFKSTNFYTILNSLYSYFTPEEKRKVIYFYELTTNTNIETDNLSNNLSSTAYKRLIDKVSIIKTVGNGNCFFEAVSTGINIYNKENIDRIIYANYGKKQIFTIKVIREIVFTYVNKFTIEEKEELLNLANTFSNDLNKLFNNEIKKIFNKEQYMEIIHSIYNSKDNFFVSKPKSVPNGDEYNTPFKPIQLDEIKDYIESADYWANDIAINAICKELKINIIAIENFKENVNLKNKLKVKELLKIPYLNLDTEQCSDRCMFLFYKNNHYDLIKFNYNKQSIIENKINKKIQNETKYYTIFNKNDLPPPLHILLLIFGSYYINLEDSAKKKFKFYKYLFDGFNESLNKQLAILNNTEFNKSFIALFPASKNKLNELYNKIQNAKTSTEINISTGGAANKINKPSNEQKLEYSIIIDMELYPGTSLTPEKIKELKCDSKYNMIRKAYAEFIGKPYIVVPVYNKTNKNNQINKNNQKKSKTKKLKN